MIFQVPELLEFISHIMTLEPGDVLVTGTVLGVRQMMPGDRVRAMI